MTLYPNTCKQKQLAKTLQNKSEKVSKKLFLGAMATLTLSTLWAMPSAVANPFVYLSPTVLEGCYSDSDSKLTAKSICLFADGTFYQPISLNITGNYEVKGNKLSFYPHKKELFEIYARRNPTLKEGAYFNFTGFNLDSLINFDGEGYTYLPVKVNHCYWQPKVDTYQHPVQVRKLSLAYAPQGDGNLPQSMVSYNYQLPQSANDFLMIYHHPDISDKRAIVLSEDNQIWIQMSKDALSLQKLDLPYDQFQGLKAISQQVRQSGGFPKFIDQDNMLVMENINDDTHLRDEITNRYYRLPERPANKKQAKAEEKNPPKAEFVKMYRKLNISGQSISKVVVDVRQEGYVMDDCL